LEKAALASLLTLCLFSPLAALAKSKDEVADPMLSPQHLTDWSCAQIYRKLVTVEVSPEIWKYISDTDPTDGLQQMSTFCPGMTSLAKRMGWGDLQSLIYNNPGLPQDQNPLVGQMIDSWIGKISLKLVCNFKPTGDPALNKALQNICRMAHSLEEDRIVPRSGKMFLTITASPTATKPGVTVTPDGTTFNIVVPVYADYDPESVATALAKCAGGAVPRE
jgi:hypothetical protein